MSPLASGLDDATLEAIRIAFAADPPRPISVAGALSTDTAARLVEFLTSIRSWQREHFVEEFLGAARPVSEREFAAASPPTRFARWDTVSLDELDREQELAGLMEFLASPGFCETLRSLGRSGVKPPSFKLRRYGPGDFFGPHCDGDEGIGVLIHLTDPPWQMGDGGRLIYEPSAGDQLTVPPHFNSAVFLPYVTSATHRVEPVAPHGATRYTLGCDYA